MTTSHEMNASPPRPAPQLPPQDSLWVRAGRHPLVWPLVTLALILAVNASLNPGLWHLEWRDGHLYGSLIDIVNRAAPLAIVALGLTLVIATRGIDVAAKQELMNEVMRLAREGMAVLFISSEIDEVLRISDRIVVMRDRRKAGELPRGATEAEVMSLICEPAAA